MKRNTNAMTWKQTLKAAWANRHNKGLFYKAGLLAKGALLTALWFAIITMPAWADYIQF